MPQYIERHALYGGLGRALADGWEAFDRGELADAERLGQQAYEIARDRCAAFRRADACARSAKLPAIGWSATASAMSKAHRPRWSAVERFTPRTKTAIRDNFTAQMPSKETYLKAMGKGLVELYARQQHSRQRVSCSSTTFCSACWMPTKAHLEDAEFWREAALKTLGEHGPSIH